MFFFCLLCQVHFPVEAAESGIPPVYWCTAHYVEMLLKAEVPLVHSAFRMSGFTPSQVSAVEKCVCVLRFINIYINNSNHQRTFSSKLKHNLPKSQNNKTQQEFRMFSEIICKSVCHLLNDSLHCFLLLKSFFYARLLLLGNEPQMSVV